MPGFLQKVFKLYPGEGLKVLQFALLAGLIEAGLAVGLSTADTLFLLNVGYERLSIIYIFTPVIMLGYLFLYSLLLSRIGIDRLFYLILFVLLSGGILLYAGINALAGTGGAMETVLYYAAKFYANLWLIALFTLIWNFIDSYFDIVDAKRLYPLFSAGAAVGGIAGGAAVSVLVDFLPVQQLFLAWSAIALMAWPVLSWISRTWKKIDVDELPEEEEEPGILRQTVETLRSMKRSRYTVILAASLFLTMFIATTLQYQYMGVLSQDTDEADLAALFGKLYMGVNVLNLIVSLFLFNRLVILIGVRNTALIQPLAHIAVFAYFLIDHGLGAAVAGFIVVNGVMTAIESENTNFLFNGLPSKSKNHIRGFIEGLGEPTATAAAGVFLILTAQFITAQQISAIALVLGVVSLIVVLVLRREYVTAILDNLKKGWLDFSLPWEPMAEAPGESDLRLLRDRSEAAEPAVARTAIRTLWVSRRREAVARLLDHLQQCTPEQRREGAALFAKMLASEDNEVLQEVILWLNRENISFDPELIEELGTYRLLQAKSLASFTRSANPIERGAAAVGLWRSWNIDDGIESLRIIRRLLGGEGASRIAGIRSLGKLGQSRYAALLVPFLADPSREARIEALHAVVRLANRDCGRLIDPLLDRVRKGESEERMLVFEAIEKIGDSGSVLPMLALARHFTPAERRRAEQTVLHIGHRTVPALTTVLQGARYSTFSRSIAARALSKLAFPQLQMYSLGILERVTHGCYEFIDNSMVLRESGRTDPGVVVLARVYRDLPSLVIEFVLEILSLVGRLPNYELVINSLRSHNQKVRGNAIETIEQACSRREFLNILPLIDGRPVSAVRDAARKRGIVSRRTPFEIIRGALESEFPLESAAAVHALYEIDPGEAKGAMFRKLRQLPFPILERTIYSILAKEGESAENGFNPIERAHLIGNAPFFEGFTMQELELLVVDCAARDIPEGESVYRSGDPADGLYLVVEGAARIDGAGEIEPRRVGASGVFGEEALHGSEVRSAECRSEGLKTLFFRTEHLLRCARIYPQVAHRLIRMHEEIV